MFDRISDAAEKLASNVSRRAFLGRLGRGAMVTASLLAGMFALTGKAWAFPARCCLCSGSCYKVNPNQVFCPMSRCQVVYCHLYPNVCPQT